MDLPTAHLQPPNQCLFQELAPLVITVETKTFYDDPAVLSDDPLVRELSSNASGISVLVRSNRSNGCPTFVIRGSVFQSARIRTAALTLQQRFMNTVRARDDHAAREDHWTLFQTQALCSTTIEILQQQHAFVLGPQNNNIALISQRTGASIHYPRSESMNNGSTTFLIQGTIDAVLNARKHLVGCLPMSFVFEAQNEGLTSAHIVSELEKQYGLSISLRPKRNGDARVSPNFGLLSPNDPARFSEHCGERPRKASHSHVRRTSTFHERGC